MTAPLKLTPALRAAAREALLIVDPVYWARTKLNISVDDWQRDLMRTSKREVCCAASRQVGKSFTAGLIVGHLLDTQDDAVAVSVSPSMRQSSEMVRRVRTALTKAGRALPTSNSFGLETDRGSRLIAVPGGEDGSGARGFTASLLVLDEGAFLADDVVAAVRPMVATKPDARVISISSTGAAQGWFFELWRAQDDAVAYFDIKATQCPRISQEFLEAELRRLGRRRFGAEYLNEWLTSGSSFFSEGFIATLDRRAPVLDEAPFVADPQAAVEAAAAAHAASTVDKLLSRRRA